MIRRPPRSTRTTHSFPTGRSSDLAVGASLVSLLAVALANPHITGIAVVGLGLLVNLAALVANNGMPVRPAALVEAGLATEDELPTLTVDPPRHLETSADRFAVLGDVLPLAPLNEVVSFGDLIVVAGAADAVRELARRRRQRWNDREVASYVSATTAARVAQDWGAAPSGAPVSGPQCSEKPDRVAPATSADPMADAMLSTPALAASRHNREDSWGPAAPEDVGEGKR